MKEWSRAAGRPATLNDIPDAELDRLAAMGFDWIWLLSVWQTGPYGQRVSREHREWRREFEHTLPDLQDEDIAGSGFAITAYTVHQSLGGDAALARLRERLRRRGLKLMLDFVPNHTAPDHPWVAEHPEFYIAGTEEDLARAPLNYTRVTRTGGDLILAHGRDPHFDGWPDTLQLDYAQPALQKAMTGELLKIASQCDGVRCDMAMLVLPDVFERTWGHAAPPFWPEATREVRRLNRGFCFMAEVYWDLEWTLLQQGFDYAYDKRLYDRLREGHTRAVRDHLCGGLDYQRRLARFLENHDEARAAAFFPADKHEAAAVLTYLAPGLRFFHQGQLEGRLKRVSPHLGRAPDDPADGRLQWFYDSLLQVLQLPVVRRGEWRLLDCVPACPGDGSNAAFIAFAWQDKHGARLLVAVNFSPQPARCYVRPPFTGLAGRRWRLLDLFNGAVELRDGAGLESSGLSFDAGPWQYHLKTIEAA